MTFESHNVYYLFQPVDEPAAVGESTAPPLDETLPQSTFTSPAGTQHSFKGSSSLFQDLLVSPSRKVLRPPTLLPPLAPTPPKRSPQDLLKRLTATTPPPHVTPDKQTAQTEEALTPTSKAAREAAKRQLRLEEELEKAKAETERARQAAEKEAQQIREREEEERRKKEEEERIRKEEEERRKKEEEERIRKEEEERREKEEEERKKAQV